MGGAGGGGSYPEVRIDPSTIRGLAEKIHFEREQNVESQLDEIKVLFSGGELMDKDGGDGASSSGYLFGISTIMNLHATYLATGGQVLDGISAGMQALANAAACAAEDHATLDEQNAMTGSDVLGYFQPPVHNPSTDKWVDPDTGAWSFDGPPDSSNAPMPK